MKRIILTPFLLLFIAGQVFAQDSQKLTSLTKKVMEAKANDVAASGLEELKGVYYKEAKFSDFVVFLKSLMLKKNSLEPAINYYIALTRYSQLKYLEEKQSWDEYFSSGNDYRQELSDAADKVIASLKAADPMVVHSRLILWQFHKGQQDVFAEDALENLVAAVKEYAQTASDTKPIKEAADTLLSYGEKSKSKELYRLYAQKIITSEVKDEELAGIAANFYKEGNLELSESIYDAYIERAAKVLPQYKLVTLLSDIAKSFAYKSEGLSDPLYAEKIFQKLEDLSGNDVFDEELTYQRALNLEKAKEYKGAGKFYLKALELAPQSPRSPKVNFKLGMISAYVSGNLEEARGYFEKLAQEEKIDSYVLSGLYQLGLLSQWQENNASAKDYYTKLLEKAGVGGVEIKAATEERLKEIEEGRPLEYNLKTFLDLSLKEENSSFNMSKVDLKSQPSISRSNAEIALSSSPYIAQSGCLQVELNYLWSGDLGLKKPQNSEANFSTSFSEPGTKVINLVVVSPSGVTDRSLELIDIE
jgi:Flp pilus assembly protein TadD